MYCTVSYFSTVQYSTKSVNINNNKYLLASVYERRNEKSLIPPSDYAFAFLKFDFQESWLSSALAISLSLLIERSYKGFPDW